MQNISSTNLCTVVAIIYLFLYKRKAIRAISLYNRDSLLYFYISIAFCILINIVNDAFYINIGVKTLSPIVFVFVVFRIVAFSLYCLVEYSKFSDLVKTVVAAFLVQVVAVFLAVINYNVRMYLYNHFYFGDDRFKFTVDQGTRILGIALNSAAGSVVCSTVIAVLCALKIKGDIKPYLFWTLSGLFVTMTFFIARTGVLVEIGLISFFVIAIEKRVKNLIYVAILIFGILFVVNFFLSQIDSQIAEYLWTWMTDPYREEAREGNIAGMAKHIPAISKELIFGTNVIRGKLPYGNEYVRADSGYIQMFCSIGIVGAFLYYSALFKILISDAKKLPYKMKSFIYVMVLIAFIIEYKEPFFQMATFAWVIQTIKLFLMRESNSC